MERRREIYIKINELSQLVSILKNINKKESQLKELFSRYDALNMDENKIFENWGNYLEDTSNRMDNLRL